nr:hypothetical protein CFP56_30166 [Quercus suber]
MAHTTSPGAEESRIGARRRNSDPSAHPDIHLSPALIQCRRPVLVTVEYLRSSAFGQSEIARISNLLHSRDFSSMYCSSKLACNIDVTTDGLGSRSPQHHGNWTASRGPHTLQLR